MDSDSKSAFRQAILKSLPILQENVSYFLEPYLVWKKQKDGHWHGEYQQKPSLDKAYIVVLNQLGEINSTFSDIFFAKHPEYEGMVGFPRLGLFRLDHDRSYILGSAISILWNRHGTFDCDESFVDAIVDEFEEFIDQPTARFRFQAQLLNFHMPSEQLNLPGNIIVRRLSEEEVSNLYGGSLKLLGSDRSAMSGIHEFVIEGEIEEEKIFNGSLTNGMVVHDNVKAYLNKGMLSFRTFKSGQIGYDSVHFKSIKFCPIPVCSHGYLDLYVPFGSYRLSEDEMDAFSKHATLIFSLSESAMEMACRRLSDAECRFDPQDRLVDAVIGMESLLLAGLGKEGRGELRYRFSLHYSVFFGSPEERYCAFLVAKDLYDLRSRIAHGDCLRDEKFRVGHDQLNLSDAANQATEALRMVIHHFLPQSKDAPYKKSDFWERAYFQHRQC